MYTGRPARLVWGSEKLLETELMFHCLQVYGLWFMANLAVECPNRHQVYAVSEALYIVLLYFQPGVAPTGRLIGRISPQRLNHQTFAVVYPENRKKKRQTTNNTKDRHFRGVCARSA